ncbi:MAG: hypothetical protein GY938_30770 [Ketobacter sp.]|nr:hypothetical protein [Ketobacter sp.]
MNKQERQALFQTQRHCCALCLVHADNCKGWTYRPVEHVLVCRRCSTALTNYVSSMARGITPAAMDALLAMRPKPEPETDDDDDTLGTKTVRQATPPTHVSLIPEPTGPETMIIDSVVCDAATGEPIE